jgi:hypothetical protein
MKTKRALILSAIMVVVWLVANAISSVIYDLFWDAPNSILDFVLTWQFILAIIFAVIIYKSVRAVSFAIYSFNGWSSVRLNIRKNRSWNEPVKVKYWRIVTIMPLIITGIIPYIASFIWGVYPLMYLSILMIFGNYRDVLSLYRKQHLPSDT